MSLQDEFIKAYEQYSDAIFRHCYYRIYHRERARELTQDVFMKTWRYIAEGKQVENLRAFLYRVANNIIIDEVRKKKEASLEQLSEAGFNPGTDPQPQLAAGLELEKTLVVLNQLDEKYKTVITLRYVEGYSPREIAKIFNESENTVSVRLHRGLKQLRSLIAYE